VTPGVSFKTPTNSCTYFGPLALDTYYYVTITVTNALGDSVSLTFSIVSTNDLPIVYAGDSVTTFSGMYTMLATASDPQGRPLTYSWVNTVWPPYPAVAATISDTTALDPIVNFNGNVGAYTFVLTASNGKYSASSTVIINYEQAAFQFFGSFVGIDNTAMGSFGSPGVYPGLGQMILNSGETADLTFYSGGVAAIYYSGPGVPFGQVYPVSSSPYVGPGTFNFYSVMTASWESVAADPDYSLNISVTGTVYTTNTVVSEPAGVTVNPNPQTGTTDHFPINPGTLTITIDFGSDGMVVLQDIYGNTSLVITTNTTSFIDSISDPLINYSTGAWTVNVLEDPPSYNPPPPGATITVGYTYTISTPVSEMSTRIQPCIYDMENEQSVALPYISGVYPGAGGAFSDVVFKTRGISFDTFSFSDITNFNFTPVYATVISGSVLTSALPLISGGADVLFEYAISGSWIVTSGYPPPSGAFRSLTGTHYLTGYFQDDSTLPLMPGAVSSYLFGTYGLPFYGPPDNYWFYGTIG
jgi:hypothetical protein